MAARRHGAERQPPGNWIEEQQDWLDPQGTLAGARIHTRRSQPSIIFVRDDKAIGIIDWETAGWYPEYWEYMSDWTVFSMAPQ
ncbi:uncharacterized protein PG998_010136 [Apiospora kogelbergensis]|uniref:uncharacterized protein n=1 Tax=Apiospora kogelbergensis TaxID=1337665 RepID=UPI00312E41A5